MSIVVETIDVAAAGMALDFPAPILRQLRGYNVISGDGELIDLDHAASIVSELRSAQSAVAGKPILISDAAERYGFDRKSIHNWIEARWVKVLIPEPRRRVDEGDIALAKAISNLQGHMPGRAVFPAKPRSGRPKKKE